MNAAKAFNLHLDQINSSARAIQAHFTAVESESEDVEDHTRLGSLFVAPQDVKIAQKRLLESSMQLQQSLTGPVELWEQMTLNHQYLSCFRWVLHFSIPSIVPLDGAISYEDVATTANVPIHQLRHIVRMLIAFGLFTEPSTNMVAHSPLSSGFRSGSLYLTANRFLTEITAATSYRMVEMTTQYRDSQQPNETAFNIALRTDLPFFGYLGQNPAMASGLAAGMKILGGNDGTHVRHLINGFDWGSLGTATVIDVGGSTGHASIALAEAFSDLKFEVQDLPSVIAKAKAAPLPPAVAGRITYKEHDFFQPQPASSFDASVFLVRLVLQNHSTSAAQAVLRNIATVMNPKSVILINNTLMPEPGIMGARQEALERARCLFMMQAMNGLDRDENEFQALVEGSKASLKIRETRRPEGGGTAVIVVEKR